MASFFPQQLKGRLTFKNPINGIFLIIKGEMLFDHLNMKKKVKSSSYVPDRNLAKGGSFEAF